ncbi:MAG: hypothetical protein GC158_06285 [Cyanobacteria bacterium RI_101]|nr:hypothetical protein [Cyanobacteria bacterium RI_101]
MSKDVSKIKVACVSLGCILSLPLLLVSIVILELLFIAVMLELNKSRSREESKLIQKAQNQLEQLIRENRSEEAVDLMLNKEYWHKQNIKIDKITGFWSYPINHLSQRYPEYSLALQKKCKILQADPLQRPLRNEIYCDSTEKILENRQKFESVLEKLTPIQK